VVMLSLSIACLVLAGGTDSEHLIVPGKSIGEIKIGDDFEKLTAHRKKPNFGDAAMGHLWATWLQEKEGRLDVYAVRGAGNMPRLQSIRITSAAFRLVNGLHVGSSMADLEKAWPRARRLHFMHGFSMWDDAKYGLVFEGQRDKCVALAVHPAGQWIQQSYIPYLSGGMAVVGH